VGAKHLNSSPIITSCTHGRQNRRQKNFNGGLDLENLIKTPLIYSVSCGGLGTLFREVISPPNLPCWRDWSTYKDPAVGKIGRGAQRRTKTCKLFWSRFQKFCETFSM